MVRIDTTWPDSQTFWRDKRVIVTGGSGFLGSFVVDKLRERGAAEIIVPRRSDYDLRDLEAIRRLLADVSAQDGIADGRRQTADGVTASTRSQSPVTSHQPPIPNHSS